jgi:hypothetical protein
MITKHLTRPWRKSSYSNSNSNCVETASGPGTVAVRDTKDPNGPRLAVPAEVWRTFTRRVRDDR